ncbi:MAG: carboxyl transferase [Lachnospiraceae bacterium]|nr:carboxyl transferase [Lachnospiraceae bacterium]
MSNTSTQAVARIQALLDEGSFMEIGNAVTARSTDFNLAAKKAPSDGVVIGHGTIDGNLVFVYSQDVSVLNGTIGEMHARKIATIYDMAVKMGAPVIALLDCGGIRLQESYDALSGLGKIYRKMGLSSGIIPQISVVLGNCGGGLSVLCALSDFTFVEKEKGRLFLNSPDAVKENTKEKCDTAGSAFQAAETGNVDMVGTESEIYTAIRTLIPMLPDNNAGKQLEKVTADDLNRACASMDTMVGDGVYLLSEIADDHVFFETKRDYGKQMTTGFLQINGTTIGAVANTKELHDEKGAVKESMENVLTAAGVDKAVEFINFCDAFEIPVLTLTNVKGFCRCMCAEKRLPKAMAKLVSAYTNATVPKVTVVTGEAYGSAGVIMGMKEVGADLVYAWETAKISMMESDLAAKIMYDGEDAAVISEKAKEYDALQANIDCAAARGYVDRIIAPADTRKYLAAAFEMLYTKSVETPYKKHGTK